MFCGLQSGSNLCVYRLKASNTKFSNISSDERDNENGKSDNEVLKMFDREVKANTSFSGFEDNHDDSRVGIMPKPTSKAKSTMSKGPVPYDILTSAIL